MSDRDKEIHIFTGHFGSGKTEVALNFAIKAARTGKAVTIIDLDTVNPYFRTNDARKILEENGIRVIASEFASTNIDMPTVPAQVGGVFETGGVVIFDVGGDEDGAYALGQYNAMFEKCGYKMHMVVNTKRMLTQTADELFEMARDIENSSRLKITDIYNNTNLARITDEATLMSGVDEIKKLSKMLGVDITKHCGVAKALKNIDTDKAFLMEIYIKMPFE